MKWENKGKQLDYLGNKFIRRKTIIFFGITNRTIDIYKKIEYLHCNILFCDNTLAGEKIEKYEIYTLNQVLPKLDEKESLLIIAIEDTSQQELLKKRLILSGYVENEDFFDAHTFEKTYLSIWQYYAYGKCYVDYINHIPNYSCTLKCKKCSASIPYLQIKNPSTEQLKKEIDLFFAKVDYCATYDCTGGEVFIISEKLVGILEYLINAYGEKIGTIAITTNATVIPPDNMLKFLFKYREIIEINISGYETVDGWKEKFNEFTTVLNKWGIPWKVIYVDFWIDFGFNEVTLNKTDEELRTYFDECGNFCRAYIDGKIFYCGHGHWANKAFYPEENDDKEAIDLANENVEKSMIVEYNLGYVQNGFLGICRHCQGWGIKNQCFIPVAEQIGTRG